METIDELNDEIRARVNEEIPRPAGGFESAEAEDAWRDAHEKRFLELCRESADAENRIREVAPELLRVRFIRSDYLRGVDSGRRHFELNAWFRCENERKCRSGVDSDVNSIRKYWSGYLDGMNAVRSELLVKSEIGGAA